jgi:predicted nucleic acid-binding Zn ribbon protein
MTVSSRTPEGFSGHCPVCGKELCVDPSTVPTRDAPCPSCGSLLWFSRRGARRRSLAFLAGAFVRLMLILLVPGLISKRDQE